MSIDSSFTIEHEKAFINQIGTRKFCKEGLPVTLGRLCMLYMYRESLEKRINSNFDTSEALGHVNFLIFNEGGV